MILPTYYKHYDRAFMVMARTEGPDYRTEANRLMLANPGWSLLHADDDAMWAILAETEDSGIVLKDLGRVRRLLCCCCAGVHYGRQWHNQDTGHGLGACCMERCTRGFPNVREFIRCYGYPGIHYAIPGHEGAP